jgi:hypothetical protein
MAKSKGLSVLIADVESVIEKISHGNLTSRSAIVEELENALFKHRGKALEAKEGEFDLYFPEDFDNGVPWCRVLERQVNEFASAHENKYPPDLYVQFMNHWSTPNKLGQPAWWTTMKSGHSKRFFVPGRLATWWQGYRPSRNTPNASVGKTLGSARAINSAVQELIDKGLVKTGKDFQ